MALTYHSLSSGAYILPRALSVTNRYKSKGILDLGSIRADGFRMYSLMVLKALPIFIPHLRFSFYQYMENGQVKVSLAMKRLMYYNLPKKALYLLIKRHEHLPNGIDLYWAPSMPLYCLPKTLSTFQLSPQR